MATKTIIFMNDSKSDYVEPIKYSFPGCEIEFLEQALLPPEVEQLASKINKEYDQVVFFDYCYTYYSLLSIISKKIKVKWILDTSIASFFNADIYNSFLQILEYKERNLIDTIAVLDYSTYLTFKNKYDLMHLSLDIGQKKESTDKEDAIGIIGYDYMDYCSFYNELSAIVLSGHKNINIENQMDVTKKFGKDFGLNMNVINNPYELIANSNINLYVNFSNTKTHFFLYSMDNKIPCVLGNTNILNNNKKLKDLFVVKSDDSIDEISDKIKDLENVDASIFEEYSKWRKEYSKKSKSKVKDFINK